MAEVMQDADYYGTSGGGITLSGGEPMLQPDFAAELLHACVGQGVQTAVETNLYYDFSILEKMLCSLTLVMCDMKVFDNEKHRKSTGVDNGLILENLRLLGRKGFRYVIRTPVIPGLNDSEEEISAIASFASQMEHRPLYYELLNFNPLGAGKYEALGFASKYAKTRPLNEGRMQELADAAKKRGVHVRVG
jgi:pyruvate formate lyase activating enzyme